MPYSCASPFVLSGYINIAHVEMFFKQLNANGRTAPKPGMGLERLPSGKFATNALILNLAALVYNCLHRIGQEALTCKEILPVKIDVARRRLRAVLQDLIYVGCKCRFVPVE